MGYRKLINAEFEKDFKLLNSSLNNNKTRVKLLKKIKESLFSTIHFEKSLFNLVIKGDDYKIFDSQIPENIEFVNNAKKYFIIISYLLKEARQFINESFEITDLEVEEASNNSEIISDVMGRNELYEFTPEFLKACEDPEFVKYLELDDPIDENEK